MRGLTIRNIRRLFHGIWIYLDHPHQLSVSTRWQNGHYPINPDCAGANRNTLHMSLIRGERGRQGPCTAPRARSTGTDLHFTVLPCSTIRTFLQGSLHGWIESTRAPTESRTASTRVHLFGRRGSTFSIPSRRARPRGPHGRITRTGSGPPLAAAWPTSVRVSPRGGARSLRVRTLVFVRVTGLCLKPPTGPERAGTRRRNAIGTL